MGERKICQKAEKDGKERRGMEPVLLLPGIDSLISLIV